MNSNLYGTKKAKEFVFFLKRCIKTNHTQLFFNQYPAVQETFQKLLGTTLDTRLLCPNEPLKTNSQKKNRAIELL